MANSETADLMDVGQHCAHVECRQLDFLPFKCQRCSKVYCLEHRVCGCTSESKQVVVCPLCARAVIISPGEDVELVFDRHTRSDCDPSHYDRVHRKPRCPASSCREKLTSTNSYTCRDCGVTVCLKHRLQTDHQCAGRAATTAAAGAGRLNLSQSLRRMFSTGSGGGAAAAAGAAVVRQQQQQQRPQQAGAARPAANGTAAASPANRLFAAGQKAAAAAARTTSSLQSQVQEYRQRQRTGAAPGEAGVIDLTTSPGSVRSPAAAASGVGGGGGSEVCPQCGARFASVAQLIEHAESAHAAGWSSGAMGTQQQQRPAAAAAGGGGLERCPHCAREFSCPVELVAHVERQHGTEAAAGTRDNCVLC